MKNKNFWENTFKNNLKSQRNFPNEELCRFLGRNYKDKKKIKVLELGCGTGANVPAILHHNMSLTAIDFSKFGHADIKIEKASFSNFSDLVVHDINLKVDFIKYWFGQNSKVNFNCQRIPDNEFSFLYL